MKFEGEQNLLRVFLRNTDKHDWHSTTAASVLVERAHKEKMAGATVLRGIFGLDVNGQILETGRWSIVEHVPLILEFVDRPQAIGQFLSTVSEVLVEGLATVERGHVLVYRHERGSLPKNSMPHEVPQPIVPLSTLPSAKEFPIMKTSIEGQLLRVFIGESDEWQGQSLYRAIVLKAQELGLAGATVLRGPVGFGAHSQVHTSYLLDISTDLPVIIEIVDRIENIEKILPFLDDVVEEGLVTVESVQMLRYRRDDQRN